MPPLVNGEHHDMAASHGNSLAFVRFSRRLPREFQTYWHVAASTAYAARWWGSIPKANHPGTLSQHPGDHVYPFKRINISPQDYLSEGQRVVETVRENTLVSVVTTFETYLLESTERIVFLRPDLLADSDTKFDAKDLAKVHADDFRTWLSHAIADRWVRNKTHEKVIQRIDTLIRGGVSANLETEIAQWRKWTYVRNCVAHTARRVSDDLHAEWQVRFPVIGAELMLSEPELTSVVALAKQIATAIDKRLVANVIKDADAELLTKKLYDTGVHDAAEAAKRVSSLLGRNLNKTSVDRIFATHKVDRSPLRGFAFADDVLVA